jgi:uncharacterized protein (TIGR02246 family)
MTGNGAGAIAPAVQAAPLHDSPEHVSRAFADALAAGDHHAAVSCFARDACFLTPDATVIRGRSEIRPIIAQLIAMRFELEVEMRTILRVGDTALSSERWTTRLGAAPLVQTSCATAVMKRVDGGWRLLVAAPWGWG